MNTNSIVFSKVPLSSLVQKLDGRNTHTAKLSTLINLDNQRKQKMRQIRERETVVFPRSNENTETEHV